MSNRTVTTAEELLLLHEPGFRHELVRGELRRMSPAGHWHGEAGATLTELLVRHVREHHLGKVYMAETGFLLARSPDTVLAPGPLVRLHRTAASGSHARLLPGAT